MNPGHIRLTTDNGAFTRDFRKFRQYLKQLKQYEKNNTRTPIKKAENPIYFMADKFERMNDVL